MLDLMSVAHVCDRFHLDPGMVAAERSMVIRRTRSACASLLAASDKYQMDKAEADAKAGR